MEYDPKSGAMMSNDNSAFFTDSLSYPMIAMLMLKDKIDYPKELLEQLAGIYWKQINQKYKNDFDKVIAEVLDNLERKGIDVAELQTKINPIYKQVCDMKVPLLGKKRFPPKAY